MLPAPNIKPETFKRLKDIVFKIAEKLQITGPLNMQVLLLLHLRLNLNLNLNLRPVY